MAGALSQNERAALAVLVDTMFPADEHGPGAVELGVLRFIDRGLATDTPGDLAPIRALANAAITAAGDVAQLDALGPDQREALLADLDRSHTQAFELLRRRTIEGVFADPAHGGNRDGLGWTLIGYPGPKGTFTAADQEIA